MNNWGTVQARAAAAPRVLDAWRAAHGPEATGRFRAAGTYTVSSGVLGSDLYEVLTGQPTLHAGVTVNERTAMCVSAVYACVQRIGGAVASLPLHFYRTTPAGRERLDGSPLKWLFNSSPAPGWTAAAFWMYLLQSRLLHGDAFAVIRRVAPRAPGVAGLEPVHPQHVVVERHGDRLFYAVTDVHTGRVTGYDQDDMLHVTGVGFDGVRSPSVIRHALKNAAGLALAADQFSTGFFANGARPDFALSTDQGLKPEAVDLLRNQFAERYGGVANMHKPAVLTNGLKVQPITIDAKDAQLLESRAFQVEDICRIFGVPPFMVGHTEKTTSWGSGVESMGIGFVQFTLQMHLTAIEQEINRKLFGADNPFCEFTVEGLLRGDSGARSTYYRAALGGSGGSGWMSVNEVRRRENLPDIPGGDVVAQWAPAAAAPEPADKPKEDQA